MNKILLSRTLLIQFYKPCNVYTTCTIFHCFFLIYVFLRDTYTDFAKCTNEIEIRNSLRMIALHSQLAEDKRAYEEQEPKVKKKSKLKRQKLL